MWYCEKCDKREKDFNYISADEHLFYSHKDYLYSFIQFIDYKEMHNYDGTVEREIINGK
ncbi:hypothetical protein [Spiroplasma sp. DGKH1]|uniref:hypothetical protein n=1 Tax=Spiroplasma sp. DGKH1 TaxID=3050074 RepID=UPI0034C66716